jgi:hypothetical protein
MQMALPSDGDMETRRKLKDSGLGTLVAPGFAPADGFSILNPNVEGDLVLLDPFSRSRSYL